MTDLTNPTVLEALEIAKVEWRDCQYGHALKMSPWDRLGVWTVLANDDGTCDFTEYYICRNATPADLDHAVVAWLAELNTNDEDAYGLIDRIRRTGESLVLALAKGILSRKAQQ